MPHLRTTRSTLALAIALAAALTLALGPSPAQAETASPEELATLSTASYPLFPVDDSGVHGELQVVSRNDLGSVLILTVVGIEEGRPYAAAIYAGDCGPDREVVLELESVGRANDPYVSITETELSFEAITEGDHFVYVFDGEEIDRPETPGLDVPALACGEVGLGAVQEGATD
jgi:hypothetical protein